MNSKKPIRVVIDTNLWISFLIGKRLGSLQQLLVEGVIQPVLCDRLLAEILLVTQRPKLQKYFAAERVAELIDFLKLIGLLIEIKSSVAVCRDEKDDFLLALAKDGRANYLVTGDEDLLALERFEGILIVSYQDFLSVAGTVK